MTSVITDRVAGRSLVSGALFERLVARIVADGLVDGRLAERIMDQALAFLMACAANPHAPLSPSRSIDIGWHTFILHTREYAAFCERVAGHFIHHTPDDDNAASSEQSLQALARSVEVIRAAGLVVDTDLWLTPDTAGVNCSNSGCGAGPPPDVSRIS